MFDIQCQLDKKDKQPTDLLWYAERCQQVYQRLKKIACVTVAVEQYKEKRALNTPAKKVATSKTTTQTTSSTNSNFQLSISKQD